MTNRQKAIHNLLAATMVMPSLTPQERHGVPGTTRKSVSMPNKRWKSKQGNVEG